jgi:hypothetical protein
MTEAPLRFNPRPTLTPVAFGPARCVVVDDALVDPRAARAYVVAHRDRLAPAPFNAYPGAEMPAPPEAEAALADFFRRHVQAHFPMRRLVRMNARFALVTTPPARLRPRQCIPHRDSAWIDPAHAIAASVLYLFDDPALGGTAFFAPRQDDAATRRLVHDSSVLDAQAFFARHPLPRAYPAGDAAWFERLGVVAPRFNRMVFYDGRLFHSGDIPHPERLEADPARGRLTLNGFFTGRPPAR